MHLHIQWKSLEYHDFCSIVLRAIMLKVNPCFTINYVAPNARNFELSVDISFVCILLFMNFHCNT